MPDQEVFTLLPDETVLADDCVVYPGYVYICDGVFTVFQGCRPLAATLGDLMGSYPNQVRPATVGEWRAAGVGEVRRCNLFGHADAKIGDRVT